MILFFFYYCYYHGLLFIDNCVTLRFTYYLCQKIKNYFVILLIYHFSFFLFGNYCTIILLLYYHSVYIMIIIIDSIMIIIIDSIMHHFLGFGHTLPPYGKNVTIMGWIFPPHQSHNTVKPSL
jgi:hypothetical protein